MANRRLGGATAAHLAIYVVAWLLGRLTVPDGGGLVFFWPAAGIAALWMLQRTYPGAGRCSTPPCSWSWHRSGRRAARCRHRGARAVRRRQPGAWAVTVRAGSAVARSDGPSGAEAPPADREPSATSRARGRQRGSGTAQRRTRPAGRGRVAPAPSPGTRPIGWVVRNACSTFVVVAAVLGLMTVLVRARARDEHGWDGLLVAGGASALEDRAGLAWRHAHDLGSRRPLRQPTRRCRSAYVMMVASTWIGYRFSPLVGVGLHAALLHAGRALDAVGKRTRSARSRTWSRARSWCRSTSWSPRCSC